MKPQTKSFAGQQIRVQHTNEIIDRPQIGGLQQGLNETAQIRGPFVTTEVDKLEKLANEQYEMIRHLIDKINPVLRSQPPQPKDTTEKAPSTGVPMADRLYAINLLLGEMITTTQETIQRVEL